MKFELSTPNENYIQRWVSTEGKWELGLCQMLFGVRIRCGQAGLGWVELDLCAGPSPDRQEEILRAVMLILLPVGEDVSPQKLCELFPRFQIKPIFNDPSYSELLRRATCALQSQLYPAK